VCMMDLSLGLGLFTSYSTVIASSGRALKPAMLTSLIIKIAESGKLTFTFIPPCVFIYVGELLYCHTRSHVGISSQSITINPKHTDHVVDPPSEAVETYFRP